jgi:ribonuclease G
VNNELIIDVADSEVTIALVKDKRLVEYHREKKAQNFTVGDFYWANIKRIMPGLNAAFVDVGHEKDAFLHYLDLGPQYKSLNEFSKQVISNKIRPTGLPHFQVQPDIDKAGKISDIIKSNEKILVQIAKEPISTKGARITSEISIPGRFLVLVPFGQKVNVSNKIKSTEERKRLKEMMQAIKPKNFGLIVRTVAETKNLDELESDLNDIIGKWNDCFEIIKTAKAPAKVYGELDRTSAIIRDLVNNSFHNIHVNDESLFKELKAYLTEKFPEKASILKLYKNNEPIFEHYGIEKQIMGSFGKVVGIKGGGYLVIEHTEAMHVIDVNSGHRTKNANSQNTNAIDINIEAAKEVARQLRLRDMGGIIVVDFVDMKGADGKKLLFDTLTQEMSDDRARHTILPPSRFGLIQITRARVRPEVNLITAEKCPTCQGSGEIQASILLEDEIENNLRYLIEEQNEKQISISLHPFLAAYFTKGIMSKRIKWLLKYKQWIRITPVVSYTFMEYHFFNGNDEIKV